MARLRVRRAGSWSCAPSAASDAPRRKGPPTGSPGREGLFRAPKTGPSTEGLTCRGLPGKGCQTGASQEGASGGGLAGGPHSHTTPPTRQSHHTPHQAAHTRQPTAHTAPPPAPGHPHHTHTHHTPHTRGRYRHSHPCQSKRTARTAQSSTVTRTRMRAPGAHEAGRQAGRQAPALGRAWAYRQGKGRQGGIGVARGQAMA